MPQILEAVPGAIERGLRLPLVYNTGAYDSLESIRLLDGVVDIYIPDFKLTGAFLAPSSARPSNWPPLPAYGGWIHGDSRKAVVSLPSRPRNRCFDPCSHAGRSAPRLPPVGPAVGAIKMPLPEALCGRYKLLNSTK